MRVAASLLVLSILACDGGDEDVYPYDDLDRVAELTCRGERAPDRLPPISPSRKRVRASLMDPAAGMALVLDERFQAESLPELSYVLCGDVVYADVVGQCGPYLGEGGSVTLFQVTESLRYRLVDPRSLGTVASLTVVAPASDNCPTVYTGPEGVHYDTLHGVPISGPFDCLLHHFLGDTAYYNQPYCWPPGQ